MFKLHFKFKLILMVHNLYYEDYYFIYVIIEYINTTL